MDIYYNVVGYEKKDNALILVPLGYRTTSLSKAILLAKIQEATKNLLFYEVVADNKGIPDDSICYYSTSNKEDYLGNTCIEFLSNLSIVDIFDNCIRLSSDDISLYLYCYYKDNNFDRPIAGDLVYEEVDDEEIHINLDEDELKVLQNILDNYKFETNQFGKESISSINENGKTIEVLEECIELIKECDDCFCSEDGIVYVDHHSVLEILRDKIKELGGK